MNEGIVINLLGRADWSGAMATVRTHMVFQWLTPTDIDNHFFPTYRNQNLVPYRAINLTLYELMPVPGYVLKV